MKLLFCCLSERIKKDEDGNLYCTGNFTPEVWNRYNSLADELHVIMEIDNVPITKKEAMNKLCLMKNLSFELYLVPRNTQSVKSYLSYKIRKKIKNIIEEQVKWADKIIVRSPNANIARMCNKYEKKYCIEVVGCVWDALWNHSIYGKILALPHYLQAKKTIMKAPYVLYVTNQFLQKRYPMKGISIGCSDVSVTIPNNDLISKREESIDCENRKLILGTVAALNVKYKGQRFVIRALAELKKKGNQNFIYQVVGGGDSTDLLNEAKRLGVAEQFEVIGQLKHDEVFEWLQKIDIYIQPSLLEGLPRAVVEAMAYGLPCMGTRTGGIPELIDEEFLFDKKSDRQLAKMLAEIDINKLKSQMRKNYEKAKQYDAIVLGNVRNAFFRKYIEDDCGSPKNYGN